MKIYSEKQKTIADRIDNENTLSNWKDWKWQIKNTIRDIPTFERLSGITFPEDKREKLENTLEKFPMAVTPYYLSLIEIEDYENDPIFMQSCPSEHEITITRDEMSDPLSEDLDSPVPGITHRYPDRVLFMISNICAMYCRHCTRKRRVGDCEYIPDKAEISKGIDYINNNSRVRDVLLSGGDPLMLDNDYLEYILSELSDIRHVEIIRLGSRMPVVLPYRIDYDLVEMIKQYHPVWLNTHFNHPREITGSSTEALRKLADGGIPLGNQSVLLAGVNDCPRIMKSLFQKLLINRVRPYYLYQCDLSEGLSHFRTPIGKGIEIIESLRGHTSGLAVPTYVVDAPGGGGKIPLMPNYLMSWSSNKVVLRNYEGVICTYKEPDTYEPLFCDRKCDDCNLQLKLDNASEIKSIGIERLLCDYDDTISLYPEDNERMGRRDDADEE
ncbi:lysine 2,3-aminomutase [Methanomicrobium antiquum]|uniref:L-lysine 2,3-aminomutase n=1 Tax=Methanomicrobium antiquum TaxID=487686 RepID=A0AAF0FMR6_9EURY|nr:lysine 2,3-aminomutase [Methanomicrobium antiquum]WFN36337.1 lysine 2,3-aminomutase [Methanomicrobium antiquum]